MLYYLHIPKSAGTSVRELFKRTYGERLIEIYRRMDTAYAQELKPRCRPDSVFFGHFSFSMHLRLDDPDAHYMTILRNPVDRVVSWYKMVVREPKAEQHDRIVRDRLTVAEAIHEGLCPELNNHSVRVLTGNCTISQSKQSVRDYCSARLLGKQIYQYTGRRYLDTAIANLNNYFCFVGIVERVDQLTRYLTSRGDLRDATASVPNVNVAPPMDVKIDSQALEVIRKANELDLILYETVAAKINQGESWYPLSPRSRSLVTRLNIARLAIPPRPDRTNRTVQA